MCLSIPGKIIEKNSEEFIVEYGLEKRIANFSVVDVEVGDYVVVSNKIIISKLNKDEALDFLKRLKYA